MKSFEISAPSVGTDVSYKVHKVEHLSHLNDESQADV